MSKTAEQAKPAKWRIVIHWQQENVVLIKDKLTTKMARWTSKSFERTCIFMCKEFMYLWRWVQWVWKQRSNEEQGKQSWEAVMAGSESELYGEYWTGSHGNLKGWWNVWKLGPENLGERLSIHPVTCWTLFCRETHTHLRKDVYTPLVFV